jgi:hypothetical protein
MHEALCRPSGTTLDIVHAERRAADHLANIGSSTEFPNFRIYGSCGGIDFVVPSVDDGVAVEIVDELDDALFELVFRADANVAEHRAGSFGEEALDEIEPRPVLGVNTN